MPMANHIAATALRSRHRAPSRRVRLAVFRRTFRVELGDDEFRHGRCGRRSVACRGRSLKMVDGRIRPRQQSRMVEQQRREPIEQDPRKHQQAGVKVDPANPSHRVDSIEAPPQAPVRRNPARKGVGVFLPPLPRGDRNVPPPIRPTPAPPGPSESNRSEEGDKNDPPPGAPCFLRIGVFLPLLPVARGQNHFRLDSSTASK